MIHSPLSSTPLFYIGPIPVTAQVLSTWAIIALLSALSVYIRRRLGSTPGKTQTLAELLLTTLQEQIRATLRTEPEPFLPLIGGLFLFVLSANLSSLVPGNEAPTAHIETDAALSIIVFLQSSCTGCAAEASQAT